MKTPVDYNDAMQILEDPKAAAWELRDLAKSLLEDLLATQARVKEMRDALQEHVDCQSCCKHDGDALLGDKP